MFCRQGGLADKTGDIECTREDIAQEIGFGTVVEAEPGRAFDTMPGLVGVATFGIGETANAKRPGRGIDFEVTSQAQAVITRQDVLDEKTEAQGMVGVSVGTRFGVRR